MKIAYGRKKRPPLRCCMDAEHRSPEHLTDPSSNLHYINTDTHARVHTHTHLHTPYIIGEVFLSCCHPSPSPDVLCSPSSAPRAWYLSFLQNLLLCFLGFHHDSTCLFFSCILCPPCNYLFFFWLKFLPRQIQKHTISCWFRKPQRSHNKRQQVQIITSTSADAPRLCSRERNQVTWQSCKFYCMRGHAQKQMHKYVRRARRKPGPSLLNAYVTQMRSGPARAGWGKDSLSHEHKHTLSMCAHAHAPAVTHMTSTKTHRMQEGD